MQFLYHHHLLCLLEELPSLERGSGGRKVCKFIPKTCKEIMDVGIRVWTALNKYVVVPFFLWCCPFFVLWCIFPLLWIQRSVCFPQQWYQIYGLGDQRIEGYWRSLRKLMMDPCRVLMSKVSWQCESNSVFQWRDLAYKFRSVIIQYSQNEE